MCMPDIQVTGAFLLPVRRATRPTSCATCGASRAASHGAVPVLPLRDSLCKRHPQALSPAHQGAPPQVPPLPTELPTQVPANSPLGAPAWCKAFTVPLNYSTRSVQQQRHSVGTMAHVDRLSGHYQADMPLGFFPLQEQERRENMVCFEGKERNVISPGQCSCYSSCVYHQP
ncbi:hypothetical protein V5799_015234 [Amblyomma americanum]|uniref:Uncharacterized protein n=1 Tax=Amblyomma americanum TaxID=6943 RepID=A0AAQ4E0R1_AMBAM